MKILVILLAIFIAPTSFSAINLGEMKSDETLTFDNTRYLNSNEEFSFFIRGRNIFDENLSMAIDFSGTDFSIYESFNVTLISEERFVGETNLYNYSFSFDSDGLSSDPLALFEISSDAVIYYFDIQVEALLNDMDNETLSYNFSTYTISPVPEMNTVLMLLVGVLLLFCRRNILPYFDCFKDYLRSD